MSWLKDKFSGTAEGATLSKLETAPSRDSARNALEAQILMRLEEDEEFRKELAARLGNVGAAGPSQSLEQRGNANRGVQIAGSGNKVEM